ncbi:MAG: hypothetical protein HY903_03460 [Deltaproteobacteria bacterium]|nr:hypothetical protein [Deltaproteobacteria bacterium]
MGRFIFGSLVSLAVAGSAAAADVVDTRVTFTIADDDIARGPQQSTTGSPTIPNSVPSAANRLFYDDFEKRDTGFENLTHFVLYAHQPGFFEGLDTEAALVMRTEWLQNRGVSITEDGSYLRVTKLLGDNKLRFTAFPLNTDRFRLGYSYKISWGGSRIFTKGTDNKATPGARVEYEGNGTYAFFGAKTALRPQVQSDNTVEEDTVWGVLGGAGIDVVDELRLEGGAGYFYRGNIDKAELRVADGNGRVKTARWDAVGGSAQLVYHVGIPIGVPVDFRLYKNDPMQPENFFKPEQYNEGLSFLLQSEMSVVGQTLQNPEKPTSTTMQLAVAGDLTGRLKIGKTRVHLLAVYRDLAFILLDVPSNPNFVDFPSGIKVQPEFFVSTAIDYYFEAAHLTPGFSLGLQRPANFTTVTNAGPSPPISEGQQTLVFRTETQVDILDPGDTVGFIYAAKGTAKWDLSEAMSVIGEVSFQYDPNRRTPMQDPSGITVRVPQSPEIIGFNLLLQARF